ncbi:hypothetical protein ACM760_29895 [Pseudomonas aeruginosa]|uniref:hypothetical protein n=1 Tax=Pseudomonas aeruginosa TaxID=287 RepID=UPI00053DCA10|nr:hypothetical protein [Pseudomonas aeruginosa]HCL2711994.1 hypothetical protein [Pseudomonas aeruginosa EF8E]AYZ78619.1 hypothetical protein EGY23_20295 [Pseudomonas aeruginosa]EIU7141658.1 hypothetical protein [Pseudomonas aeruginosa]EIY2512006.1 hypothetical protein [Pseudomonas aeruginosa]EIY2817562.1 hypothetical protein [Pseudomonas aeruginosa]
MGEAKNRGSKAERVQQARERQSQIAESLGLKRRPLSDIKAELGLPDSAAFHGYAVHIPASDEFLCNIKESDLQSARQWIKGPAAALCFDEIDEAIALVRQDRGEMVVGVFETESQYHVAEVF